MSRGKTSILRPFIETSWVHDIDESGAPQYYGRLDLDGNWVIIRKDGDQIRFAGYRNNPGYTYEQAWTDRANRDYDYISAAI